MTAINPDLVKKYGESAFISGDKLRECANPIVHVSPKLDLVLGGGIPGGSVVTLAGDPKCGKTVTSLHIGAKGQQVGRPLYFLNVEGRIKPRDLDGIKGLDKEAMTIVRSYRDDATGESKILTAEEFLATAEDIIHNQPHAVVIIDSVSQLVASGELGKDIGEKSRAPGAGLLAQFTRKLSNVIPVNDIILIAILHFIANTSGYGKSKVASGGNKIKYACDIGLECKKFMFIREGGGEDDSEDSVKKAIGQKVTWVTTSTAFAAPGQVTDSIIKYGIGIDEMTELVQLAIQFGFISKGGAWFKPVFLLDAMPDKYQAHQKGKKIEDNVPSLQGEANLVGWLNENRDEYLALEKAMQSMLEQ